MPTDLQGWHRPAHLERLCSGSCSPLFAAAAMEGCAPHIHMSNDNQTLGDRVNEMERALADLAASVHSVFGHDWDYTASILAAPDLEYITRTGTFLEPGVDDESENWANRGAMLDAFRRAVRVLRDNGIEVGAR